ncbi:hypothetical protein C8J56DRAFT_957221, partial [Mycena floridula]
MDEKGIQLGVGDKSRVLVDRDQKAVQKLEHGNRDLVTILESSRFLPKAGPIRSLASCGSRKSSLPRPQHVSRIQLTIVFSFSTGITAIAPFLSLILLKNTESLCSAFHRTRLMRFSPA